MTKLTTGRGVETTPKPTPPTKVYSAEVYFVDAIDEADAVRILEAMVKGKRRSIAWACVMEADGVDRGVRSECVKIIDRRESV